MKIAPINERVLGLKLFYADGTVVRIPVADIAQGWKDAPDTGLQVVSIYDTQKFEKGHYAQWFASHDIYAWSPSSNEIIETNRPSDLSEDAVVKVGSEMDKNAFRKLYNEALNDFAF